MTDSEAMAHWHLDKRVPISIIITLVLQTLAFVYLGTAWKADVDNRIGSLEKDAAAKAAIELRLDVIRASQSERLTILEQKFDFIHQSLQRIERATVPPARP